MNKEIKEILDRLYTLPFYDDYTFKHGSQILMFSEIKIILDYITNLQEENEYLKKEKKKKSQQHIYTLDKLIETQTKIENAIEYIKENRGFIFNEYEEIISNEVVAVESILEILEGKNNE